MQHGEVAAVGVAHAVHERKLRGGRRVIGCGRRHGFEREARIVRAVAGGDFNFGAGNRSEKEQRSPGEKQMVDFHGISCGND